MEITMRDTQIVQEFQGDEKDATKNIKHHDILLN